jgi:hypothetical protein
LQYSNQNNSLEHGYGPQEIAAQAVNVPLTVDVKVAPLVEPDVVLWPIAASVLTELKLLAMKS